MRHREIGTDRGIVRGVIDGDVASFYGIPYAAPPSGADRFAPPRPHTPWSEVRDATAPGPTAPQPRRDGFGNLDMSPYFGPGWIEGEDYLGLTVRTPAQRRTGLPVMVFVHGGGFVAGSSWAAIYDGSSFARAGVVLVTLNYRLGVPGFVHLPDAPDNRGLLDVLAALRWVQRNIAEFGGDPASVTVFGQSAGATLLGAVLAHPDARGLFRRAILQSGSGTGTFSTAQAEVVTHALGRQLGVAPTAASLAEVPDSVLVRASAALTGLDLRVGDAFDPLIGLSAFSVVADRQPAEVIAGGRARDVDLLLGTNSEEGNLYLIPVGRYTGSTWADVQSVAAAAYPDPIRAVDSYRAARPGASPAQLRSAIMTDALFGTGTRALARAHGANTHVYEFTWKSSFLGAAHAVELPFVFNTTDLSGLRGPNSLLGTDSPPPELASRMHRAWIRFATTGDPGWPAYGADRITMCIGESWCTRRGGPTDD